MKKALLALLLITPFTSFAQTANGGCGIPTNLIEIVTFAGCFLNKFIVPLIFTFAICYFIYGVFKYMLKDGSDKARTEGREFIIWGVVALFVMISVWGLVNIIGKTFGTSNVIPTLPTSYK